jgi:Flp pilus assembly protein protease CpaA
VKRLIPLWLQTALVLGLALVAWICGMDATGNPTEVVLLWAVAALACAQLLFRFLPKAR